MKLPRGTTVAVVDGETFHLFHYAGDENHPKLIDKPHGKVAEHNRPDTGHHSSAANHDDRQADEDSFSTGTVEYLNTQVLEGAIEALLIIAPPNALGDMRKHYHQQLSAVLFGEVGKELTGRSARDVESAIAAA